MKTVDLFLFMGQSNMAGRGIVSPTWQEPAPVILPGAGYEFRPVTDPHKLYVMEEPFGVRENKPGGIDDGAMKTGSLVTAFTNAYYTRNGHVPVVGVSASKGGSVIGEWQPGGKYLTDTIKRLETCEAYLLAEEYDVRHKFALWCQGESDGDRGTPGDAYLTGLEALWEELQRHGIEKLFLIGIGNCNIEGAYDRYLPVQGWQKAFAAAHENVILVSTAFEGMRERGLMKDEFHYFQQGYNECGREAGNCAAEYVNGTV